MGALLPPFSPRSEHDPDLEAAAANLSVHRVTSHSGERSSTLVMHPVTGAFEDASHEAAFAAQLFRQAYAWHLLIMAVMEAHLIGIALTPPGFRAASSIVAGFGAASIVGRVLLHQQQDQERAQRIGSRSWTAMMAVFMAFLVGPLLVSLDFACMTMGMDFACVNDGKTHGQGEYIVPFLAVANSVVNGSHGMSFAHKTALIVLLPARSLLVIVFCNDYFLLEWSGIGISILGYVIAHAVEMRLRRSYADKLCTDQLLRDEEKRRLAEEKSVKKRLEAMVQLQAEKERLEGSLDEKTRRLEEEKRRVEERNEAVEERNEQLLAEKERLLYDLLRRGHPVDDDSRSAIRRGLQAAPSRVSTPYQTSDDSSKAGGPVPSASPPPSLPPGPPSSVSSGHTAEFFSKLWHTATQSEDSRQRLESNGEALAAPNTYSGAPGASSGTEMEQELATDALLAEILGDEETLLELQTMLDATEERPVKQEPDQGSQGALAAPTNALPVAAGDGVAQQRVMAHTMQDTVTKEVDSTPQGQGDKRQHQVSNYFMHEPLGSFGGSAGGSCTPTSLHAVQADNMAPRQQALHVARHRLQATRDDVEVVQVVRNLAIALGASRTEGGTIKALHAVLLQLDRHGMSCEQACASTGASRSNFTKWHRRVRHAQLNLAPPA